MSGAGASAPSRWSSSTVSLPSPSSPSSTSSPRKGDTDACPGQASRPTLPGSRPPTAALRVLSSYLPPPTSSGPGQCSSRRSADLPCTGERTIPHRFLSRRPLPVSPLPASPDVIWPRPVFKPSVRRTCPAQARGPSPIGSSRAARCPSRPFLPDTGRRSRADPQVPSGRVTPSREREPTVFRVRVEVRLGPGHRRSRPTCTGPASCSSASALAVAGRLDLRSLGSISPTLVPTGLARSGSSSFHCFRFPSGRTLRSRVSPVGHRRGSHLAPCPLAAAVRGSRLVHGLPTLRS